jgi:tetratricopeptide (TPR) repeat protein
MTWGESLPGREVESLMVRSRGESGELGGRRFSFSGRLASMTQEKAHQLLTARGGLTVAFPGPESDYLVVGGSGPLSGDGKISRKLERARMLRQEGHAIEILSEEDFLGRVGLGEEPGDVQRLYTLTQLARILEVPRQHLRRWMRCGLIRPARTVHRLAYFDFAQVASARALWKLAQAGVSTDRIRRSLRQLERWMPGIENPLGQLELLEQNHRLLVRVGDDQLADPNGQLYFSFTEKEGDVATAGDPSADLPAEPAAENTVVQHPPAARGPEGWMDWGLRCEETGRLEEALAAYTEAVRVGEPGPELCFNLGNVHYGLGQKDEAVQRFREATEFDPQYVEAWNNLANVVAELGERTEAMALYQRALDLEPHYADAHYNLAEVLRQSERLEEAREHWRAYLREDPASAWADEVRARLDETH